MRPIYLPQLAQAPQRTEVVKVHDLISGLDSLTPVQGKVKVEHRGNYLQIWAQVETIVTLSCDRCLQQYNHRLSAEFSELIWLSEQPEQALPETMEVEADCADLVEVLSPQGYFDLEDWLYQQLCLQLPHRQLCDSTCPGLPEASTNQGNTMDQRWAALAAFKQALDTSR